MGSAGADSSGPLGGVLPTHGSGNTERRTVVTRASASSVAAVVALAVLAAVVTQALVVGGWRALPGIPFGALDYDAPADSVRPLSVQYIDRVLGPDLESRAAAADASAPRPARAPVPPGSAPPPLRTVVSHGLTNDERSSAYQVQAIPFTASTDSSRAQREPDEPASCAATGATLWYAYTPTQDGTLVADTVGTDGPVSLGLFRPGEADALACDTHALGNARIGHRTEAGVRYLFQLTVPTRTSTVVFNLDPVAVTRPMFEGPSPTPNGYQIAPSVSRDGRFVAFVSDATNLVPHDTNGVADVFVLDRRTGAVERVSVASDGSQADEVSTFATAITPDGRYVAFNSLATNLVEDDTNNAFDVFVHDRHTGLTERVSVSSGGKQGTLPVGVYQAGRTGGCQAQTGSVTDYCRPAVNLSMSADGRVVVFKSDLAGLVEGQPDDARADHEDVFAHDRATGETTLISRAADGGHASDWSGWPSVSANGRWVSFLSFADDIDGGGAGTSDIFLHDRHTGTSRIISVGHDGSPASGSSSGPSLSADGRWIAFASQASNLAPDDDDGTYDAFVHDRLTGRTERVSVPLARSEQTGDPLAAAYAAGEIAFTDVSDDGRFVAFSTWAQNMVASDEDTPPWVMDVFIRDRATDTTIMANLASDGTQYDGHWVSGAISGDGTTMVLEARGRSLVDPDEDDAGRPPWPILDDVSLFIRD